MSNLYGSPQGEAFAQRLVDLRFRRYVFWAAEAVECSIKTARRYQLLAKAMAEHLQTGNFLSAFHGPPMATVTANFKNQAKLRKGFAPLLAGSL